MKLLRLHTHFNWTSHWSYELNSSCLWTSIMHGLNWSELNYCAWVYCLWVDCPCLSWSAVAMRALTWVIFVPWASHRCCALAVALHWHNMQQAGHIACRRMFGLSDRDDLRVSNLATLACWPVNGIGGRQHGIVSTVLCHFVWSNFPRARCEAHDTQAYT